MQAQNPKRLSLPESLIFLILTFWFDFIRIVEITKIILLGKKQNH